jgi:hypothetical protein
VQKLFPRTDKTERKRKRGDAATVAQVCMCFLNGKESGKIPFRLSSEKRTYLHSAPKYYNKGCALIKLQTQNRARENGMSKSEMDSEGAKSMNMNLHCCRLQMHQDATMYLRLIVTHRGERRENRDITVLAIKRK